MLLATQPHARIHSAATIAAVVAGWVLGIERVDWVAVALATGGVWAAEAMNTAVEWLVDLVHPEWHEAAGRVKDVAAASVLLAAIAAAAVGILVYGPPLFALLRT